MQFSHCEMIHEVDVSGFSCHSDFTYLIIFGEFSIYKPAIFAILGALNLAILVNFSLQKVHKFKKFKIQSIQMY